MVQPEDKNEPPKKPSEDAPKVIPRSLRLDAIIPDTTAKHEMIDDIDAYQTRMERDWETAKESYEKNINKIMEDFLKEKSPQLNFDSSPSKSEPTEKSSNEFDSLMARVRRELKGNKEPAHGELFIHTEHRDPIVTISWQPEFVYTVKRYMAWILTLPLLAALVGAFYFYVFRIPTVSTLPYTHTLGPVIVDKNILVVDWFRKVLFVHEMKKGFPLKAVEHVPNGFATGFAVSDKIFWSLDGFDHKILLHNTSPDHQVQTSAAVPGTKPIGLYYDGVDVWSADEDTKTLYRHRGNELEDIRDEFPLPEGTIAGFSIEQGHIWILDGKARLLNEYRLQKPMKLLKSYDLDFFVKGATPTGVAKQESTYWIVTENPSLLLKLSSRQLNKHQAHRQ